MATEENSKKNQVLSAEIQARAAEVQGRISAAALAAGRDPAEVHLIAVTKFFPPETVAAAVHAGLTDFGENRVQELLAKQETLQSWGLEPRWHLIGTLQRNKVKYILGKTDLIHSGDKLQLLQEISERSSKAGIETNVLLQLNPAVEESKHGFKPSEFLAAAVDALKLPALRIRGLMAMAPLVENPEETLPYFKTSNELFQELCHLHSKVKPEQPLPDVLSLGMSQDFEQAVACGSTHVRVGSAIFGNRTI